jgi:hypothetical protein
MPGAGRPRLQQVFLSFGKEERLMATYVKNQLYMVPLAVVSPLFEKMSLWDRAGFLGKAAWDIRYPIDVLGFSPSQVRKAAPGTLLSHIMKNGIEIAH